MSYDFKVGSKYGRWTVIGPVVFGKNRYALMRCECGREKNIRCSSVVRGDSHGCASCGNKTFGTKKNRAYNSWLGMKQRCEYKDHCSFDKYGGRGISICERWKEFANFFSDMGQPPEGHSLDRIDPNGDYCPENCRWATFSLQAANKRKFAATSKYLGVSRYKYSWRAQYCVNDRKVCVGSFQDEFFAAIARDVAVEELGYPLNFGGP